jgi:gamma-glutamyltranspeptidase/glutathione hydrolase
MIASANQLASQAGLSILRKGGNAVDAAVAVAFALAVVHPEAGNLGGGGYMIIRMADGTARAIDYKETAPAAAHLGMFTNKLDSTVGYKASAVPGTVAGMGLAHSRFGKLPWKEVLEPARRLAKDGFPASQRMEIILALQAPVMKQFPESAKTFLHGSDKPLKQGELVKQPDLAATIARIQKHGWREFYEGKTARLIDTDMAAHNGTIHYDDLKSYKAIERDPVKGTFRGNQILSMPPSSSGGTTLIEISCAAWNGGIFRTASSHDRIDAAGVQRSCRVLRRSGFLSGSHRHAHQQRTCARAGPLNSARSCHAFRQDACRHLSSRIRRHHTLRDHR